MYRRIVGAGVNVIMSCRPVATLLVTRPASHLADPSGDKRGSKFGRTGHRPA